MKSLFVFCMAVFLSYLPCVTVAAQDADIYVPGKCSDIGVVPEWVKKKTTPEEYAILKELSQYYRLDCTFLKSRYLTASDRAEVFKRLKKSCEEARAGHLLMADDPDRCYRVSSSGPDSVCAYKSRVLPVFEKKYLLYSSIDGYDAHVELTVVYSKEGKNATPQILKHSLKAISFSGLDVYYKPVTQDFSNTKKGLSYNSETGLFECFYTGALYFTDPVGEKHAELLVTESLARSFVP